MTPVNVPPAPARRRSPVVRQRRLKLFIEDHFDDHLRELARSYGLTREALAAQIIRDNLIARRLGR